MFLQHFYILGASFFVLMLSGASYIVRPPEGYLPDSMKIRRQRKQKTVKKKEDLAQLTVNEAVKTGRFYLLWVMMFINISSGIMILAVASPMAQEKAGLTAAAAATMVGIMGFFNGGGRIGWSTFSDFIGRDNMLLVFFGVQLVMFFLLPSISNPVVFQIFLFIIVSMYGGGFSCLPAFIGDIFGTKQLGAIHGMVLTSWSAAGVFGPMMVTGIKDATNSYDATFYLFSALLAVAFITAIAMKLNIKKIRASKGTKKHSAA